METSERALWVDWWKLSTEFLVVKIQRQSPRFLYYFPIAAVAKKKKSTTECLKKTQMYSLTVVETRSLKSRCQKGTILFLQSLEKNLALLLAYAHCQQSLMLFWPVTAWLRFFPMFIWPSSSCLLHVFKSLSPYKDTSHWIYSSLQSGMTSPCFDDICKDCISK